MSSENRIHGTVAALALVAAAFAVGVGAWQVARGAESARALGLVVDRQTKEIQRLGEKLDAEGRRCRAIPAPVAADPGSPRVAAVPAEQIDHLAAEVAARLAEANAPPPPPAPTEDNVAAADAGRRLVDAAIQKKHWTQADAREMQSLRPRLAADDMLDLQRRISVAINEQQLSPDFRGPMF